MNRNNNFINNLTKVVEDEGYKIKAYLATPSEEGIHISLDLVKILPKKSALLQTMEMLASTDKYKRVCIPCQQIQVTNIFKEIRQFGVGDFASLSQSLLRIGTTTFYFMYYLKDIKGMNFDASIVNPNTSTMWLSEIDRAMRGDNPIKIEIAY